MFAAIEGYSTHRQAEIAYKRNKIEDARNELEKAYGPLYTILNKSSPFNEEGSKIWVEPDEKEDLDIIMATYPFMFPSKIYDLWRDKIQNLCPIVNTSNLEPVGYEIFLEFRAKINEEYNRRVEEYNKLLEK